jgi:uncharacterized protein
MSASKPSRVFLVDGSDPEMQKAYQKAQATFRYFWREVAWERRRIVPALDLACVKAPFSDVEPEEHSKSDPQVEHMWLSDVDFDGRTVSGVLLNSPNCLKSVQQGDSARFALDAISDWMYAIHGEVYGGYTVNLMRARMSASELKEHDAAWGLNFGDPNKIRLAPEQSSGGFLSKLFGWNKSSPDDEHPMSEAMAASLQEQLRENPSMVKEKDDRGFTFLHQQALAGSLASVKALLEAGADRSAKTDHGMTALQLAKIMGWESVVAVLKAK